MPDPCVIIIPSGKPHKIPCRANVAVRAIIEAAGWKITAEGDVIVAISDG